MVVGIVGFLHTKVGQFLILPETIIILLIFRFTQMLPIVKDLLVMVVELRVHLLEELIFFLMDSEF